MYDIVITGLGFTTLLVTPFALMALFADVCQNLKTKFVGE